MLSTLTHQHGWLDPEVFAQRWLSAPQLSWGTEDLTLSLYRLPPESETRARAWHQIATSLETAPAASAQALKLALAPEDQARQELASLCATWEQSPPVGTLCANGLVDWAAEMRPEARHFRLIFAALRSRWGLANLAEVLPELDSERFYIRLSSLPESAWGAKNAPLLEMTPEQRQAWIRLLLHPEPLGPWRLDDAQSPYFPIIRHPHSPGLVYNAPQGSTLFPPLQAYLDYWHQDEPAGFLFPALGQRCFEAAVLNLHPEMSGSETQTRQALAAGRALWVELRPALPWLIGPFKHAEHRSRMAELIACGLSDGRLTADELAAAIETGLQAKEGGTNLDQLLQELAQTGEAQSLIRLYCYEVVIGSDLSAVTSKNISMLLGSYSTALQERSWLPPDQLRQPLESLAKGKGVVRDKARALLALEGNQRPLRLEVLITEALAAQALAAALPGTQHPNG